MSGRNGGQFKEPINPPAYFKGREADNGRKLIVESWFKDNAEERLRIAALEYLGVCGLASDLEIIKKQIDAKRTIGPATEAIIRLSLKKSRKTAIAALLELQPETITNSLISALFAKPDAIDTQLLVSAATHRSPKVRKASAPILAYRKALPGDVAVQLLSDPEADVRYWALQTLVEAGEEYSDDQVKSILVKPPTRATGGLLAIGLGLPVPDSEGEACWERFRNEKLRKLTSGALEKMQDEETIFSQDARFALDTKQFSSRSQKLRRDFDDGFRTVFANKLKKLESKHSLDSEMVKRAKDVEDYLCRQFCRKALDLLTQKSESADILRVRKWISDVKMKYSRGDVIYLGQHGEWEDISLLVKLFDRAHVGQFWSFDDEKTNDIASSIVAIGKGRAGDLLKIEMPDHLRAHVLLRMSDRNVTTLQDHEILKVLHSESDRVRRTLSLRAVKAFSKQRLKILLDSYLGHDEHRYYNVIYWLDMGISLPRRRATSAAQRALEKEF